MEKDPKPRSILAIIGYFFGLPPKGGAEAEEYKAIADASACPHRREEKEEEISDDKVH